MKKRLISCFILFFIACTATTETLKEVTAELDAFTQKIGQEQLQLMAGYKWNQYKRILRYAVKFAGQKKVPEAVAKYKEALSLAESFVEDCRIHRLKNGDMTMGLVILHAQSEELSFPAYVEEVVDMPIEVLICTDRGRMHETIFTSKARPFHLQTMMIALGLQNGGRVATEAHKKQGDHIKIEVEWKTVDKVHRRPIEYFLVDENSGEPLKSELKRWVFVGSGMNKGSFVADLTGDFAVNYTMADSIIDCSEDEIAHMNKTLSSKFPEGMKSKQQVKIIISKWKSSKISSDQEK